MLTKEQIRFLEQLDKRHIHGRNILAKRETKDINSFFEEYQKFYRAITSGDLKRATASFNAYKDFINTQAELGIKYSAQSKFSSTVLEEYLCQILKNELGNDVLQYGPVKAYSSMYFHYTDQESFKSNLQLKVNEKNQDVGIFKIEKLTTGDGKEYKIFVPIVCIECKTYLDKTMPEGSVSTASKIKNGNPWCLFYIVAETYDVSDKVDIETSQIDNIYVLRKCRPKKNPNKIQPDVVEHLLKSIKQHLWNKRSLTTNQMIEQYGYLRGS